MCLYTCHPPIDNVQSIESVMESGGMKRRTGGLSKNDLQEKHERDTACDGMPLWRLPSKRMDEQSDLAFDLLA